MRTALLAAAVLLAGLLAWPAVAGAQPAAPPGGEAAEAERERQFVESLRRDDPAEAERYVALRDARARAIAELQQAERMYRAAGAELRPVALPRLRQAQRGYAQASLALLDFLDARDRRLVERYREQIERIGAILEQHKGTRAELERVLRGE